MTENKDQKKDAQKTTETIIQQQSVDMSEDQQKKMGEPLKDSTGLDPKDMELLHVLVNKVDSKEIDLYAPSSLINHEIYDKLDESAQGKADYDAVNLLATIRQVYQLWNLENRESFQIQNLVHQIRITKERLEEVSGDIYII